MNRTLTLCAAAAVLLVAAAWAATTQGLAAKASAQLDLATGSGDNGPVTIGTPAAGPPPWQAHVPASAWSGRHRMYHHPVSCSPNLNTPQAIAYDWMFTPPAQGDL